MQKDLTQNARKVIYSKLMKNQQWEKETLSLKNQSTKTIYTDYTIPILKTNKLTHKQLHTVIKIYPPICSNKSHRHSIHKIYFNLLFNVESI